MWKNLYNSLRNVQNFWQKIIPHQMQWMLRRYHGGQARLSDRIRKSELNDRPPTPGNPTRPRTEPAKTRKRTHISSSLRSSSLEPFSPPLPPCPPDTRSKSQINYHSNREKWTWNDVPKSHRCKRTNEIKSHLLLLNSTGFHQSYTVNSIPSNSYFDHYMNDLRYFVMTYSAIDI